ncbi:protein kinase [Streptomyces calidiresistens]|uniref:non-specific serine/threonine protein kinase n=1 Tax=Streptomyces calidiresistens TaxID=1485586 RepID=A0A7W3T1Q5_9ACTN|nr:protein kinase [Streptomyces calidiresistens]
MAARRGPAVTPRLLAGRYQLTEPLGRGGMGEVWSGRDTALGGRRIAVKLLHSDRLAAVTGAIEPEELRRRFLREARATARLDHPSLVAVHDAGAEADWLYLVMQLIEGSNLAAHRAENEPYPWSWTVAVLAQLTSALVAVHSEGIVHRDLKPGNAMVRPDGRVTVLDLGIAAVREDEDTRLTRTGTLLGTPLYMAPEQALGGTPAGPRADLYALGVIGYELLTGRVPFTAPNATGLLYRKMHEDPEPAASLRPDAPAELPRLLHRLLDRDPERRPADAHALFAELEPLLGRADPEAPPGAAVQMDPTRPFRRPLAPWPPVRPAGGPHPDPELAATIGEVKRLLTTGDYTRVAELLSHAVPMATARHGASSRVVRSLRKQYATTLLDIGQYGRALPEIRRLLHDLATDLDPRDPVLAQLREDEQLCVQRLRGGVR